MDIGVELPARACAVTLSCVVEVRHGHGVTQTLDAKHGGYRGGRGSDRQCTGTDKIISPEQRSSFGGSLNEVHFCSNLIAA